MSFRLFVASALLSLSLFGCCAEGVTVLSENTERSFCADRAETESERRHGLSGRPPLPEEEGLLIVFPLEGEACISNESVSFAIDALYANEAGDIVAIERDLPAGDTRVFCHDETRYVFETLGGALSTFDVGDRIQLE